jgi:hypothetical protein
VTFLRKAAQGQPCQVRLNGVCNFDPATTVLCHFRLTGISGMAMKSPDLIGAWACSECHHAIDTMKDDRTQLDFARGVFRTQAILLNRGLVKV